MFEEGDIYIHIHPYWSSFSARKAPTIKDGASIKLLLFIMEPAANSVWGPNTFDVCPLRGICGPNFAVFPSFFFLLGPKFCDIDICDPALKLFRIQILPKEDRRIKNVWVVTGKSLQFREN